MTKLTNHKTLSDIDIPVVVGKYDANHNPPGEYPFTRGPYESMYQGRLWTMRQYSGYSTAHDTNKRFRLLLEQGQTGLSTAFDLPTQMGYDSDDNMSLGEVGKVGVAIDTVEDMIILFDQIDLSKVSTSMTINAPAMILLAMYAVVAEESGVDPRQIRGTIQNDILKEYIARGTYIFPPKQSMRLITDIFAYCSTNFPKFNTISISGYHIREAGSTAVQELAFTLINAREYVRAALSAGLDINNFGRRLSFFFNSHNEFFEEISKFRAARRMWAVMMKKEFGATDPKAMMMRFHTQTAGSSLTAQQPDNNIARVTIQAMAAVLGGTQSLHTNSKDEALALPTDASAITALRTQQIIAQESGIAKTADPLAGSYFVEWLTDTMEMQAKTLIDEIETIGVLQAIQDGVIQSKIHEAAYDHEKKLSNKERIIVGVNEFVQEKIVLTDLLRVDDSIAVSQIEQLRLVRKNRNQQKVDNLLLKLKETAMTHENLFPIVIEAVKARASIGEICHSLREVMGSYTPSFTL